MTYHITGYDNSPLYEDARNVPKKLIDMKFSLFDFMYDHDKMAKDILANLKVLYPEAELKMYRYVTEVWDEIV